MKNISSLRGIILHVSVIDTLKCRSIFERRKSDTTIAEGTQVEMRLKRELSIDVCACAL